MTEGGRVPLRSMPPTRTLTIDRDQGDDSALAEAARVLLGGGLVAIPTETVYGLAAVATDPEAVAKIFAAKGRPSTNPLIAHASDLAMARSCVADWPLIADELAQWFWPGPLTIVLPRSAIIPDIVTGGGGTVGVRVPAVRSTRALIAHVGKPLAAPSANRSNRLSPTTAEHVLRDLDGRIDLILDGGPSRVGLESTVLDLSGGALRILRPGPITARDIERVLVGLTVEESAGEDLPGLAASPGRSPIHYAPMTKAVRVDLESLGSATDPENSALLTFGHECTPDSSRFRVNANLRTPDEAAESLYRLLHDWDDLALSRIVIVLPPDDVEWFAIRDRLIRATSSGS